MSENTENKTGKFDRFNTGLAYYLKNIFRFFSTLFMFLIKVSGLLLITFPFVLFGMCLVAPESAINTLEALTRLMQLIIDLFRSIT